MELYENIRMLRKKLGMSQEDLALLTGYTSRSSIAKIEAGEVDLSQSKIEAFAKALHTTPQALMGYMGKDKVIPLNLGSGRQIPILKEVYASCGKGEWAEDDVVDYLILPTIFKLNRHKKYFAQVAKGDSMIGAGIEDGNLLIFEVNNVPEDNRIGTFSINNDTCVCKRVKIIDGKMYLVSANDNYPSIEVTEDMDFRMVGLLKYIVKEMMYE